MLVTFASTFSPTANLSVLRSCLSFARSAFLMNPRAPFDKITSRPSLPLISEITQVTTIPRFNSRSAFPYGHSVSCLIPRDTLSLSGSISSTLTVILSPFWNFARSSSLVFSQEISLMCTIPSISSHMLTKIPNSATLVMVPSNTCPTG